MGKIKYHDEDAEKYDRDIDVPEEGKELDEDDI